MVEKNYSVHQVFWMKVMSLILEAAYSVEEGSLQFPESVASFLPHSNLASYYLPRQEQEEVSLEEGVQHPKV